MCDVDFAIRRVRTHSLIFVTYFVAHVGTRECSIYPRHFVAMHMRQASIRSRPRMSQICKALRSAIHVHVKTDYSRL